MMANGGHPMDYLCNHERTNYARLCRAIVDLCCQVLRDLLEKHIPSNQILQTSKGCSKLKLNPSQRGLLSAASSRGYKDFDITLLYTLIRNLCASVQPTNGWIHGYPPTPVEVTEGDDVERIHFIRNKIYGHISRTCVTDTQFKDYWKLLENVMTRMDFWLGGTYSQTLAVIESDNMDEANEKKFMDRIKELQEFEKDLQSKIENIETRMLQTTDQQERIKRWVLEDKTFVITHATQDVMKLAKSKQLIAVCGVPGCGKSATIHHIALRMQEEGFQVVPVYTCDDILKYWSKDTKQVFVFNDPFGVHNLDEVEYNNWSRRVGSLKDCLKENKLLISVRRHFTKEQRVTEICKQINGELVDICSKDLDLTEEEKVEMFQNHMEHNGTIVSSTEELPYCTLSLFPLLCQIFSAKTDSHIQIESFFQRKLSVLQAQILGFKRNDKIKYFCLVFCLIYDGKLQENVLSVEEMDRESKIKRKTFLDLCRLPKSTSNTDIRYNLDALIGTYLIKEGNTYRFLHDIIYDTVVSTLTPEFHTSVLKHCSSQFVRQRVVFSDMLKGNENVIQPYVVLQDDAIQAWGERLIRDIKEKGIAYVIMNRCLHLQKYEKSLVKLFKDYQCDLDIGKLMCVKITYGLKNNLKQSENIDIFMLSVTNTTNTHLHYNDCTPLHLVVSKHLENICMYSWNQMDSRMKNYFVLSGSLLCTAANYGAEKLFRTLIDNGADINKCDQFHRSPLLYAAASGCSCLIKFQINKGVDVNNCDEYQCTPLWLASKGGYNEVVQMLVDQGADVNQCDSWQCTPLYLASRGGHDQVVQLLVDKGADVNHCDSHQRTALWWASKGGYDKVIQILVDKGADVNKCDFSEQTPLLCASEGGHDKAVQILIDKGADVNQYDIHYITPLLCVSVRGYDKVVQMLIDKGAEVNQCDNDQLTPLFWASLAGHDKVVQILVDKGADVKQYDINKRTLLWWAARKGNHKVVQVLINKGVDINQHDIDQRSPLWWASFGGYDKVVKILVDKGVDVNQCDIDQHTPLLCASALGQSKVVQTLLDKGAAVNQCNNEEFTPLLWASRGGHGKVAKILVDKGAAVNQCDNEQCTPLLWASQRGHDRVVQILVDKGAALNQCDNEHCTPLLWASAGGHDKVVQILVDEDVDINQCDKEQCTPLLWASAGGHDKVVQILVDKGAALNQCDNEHCTPLLWASAGGHDKVVQILVDEDVDINQCDKEQCTPLSWASAGGHDKVVQILVDKGAALNQCDNEHCTPLLWASAGGHDKVVQILVDKGAALNQCDNEHCTPLLWASQRGHDKVVQILVDKGAALNQCDNDQCTPLLWASAGGHDKVVQILVDKGVDINQCDNEQCTPLWYASIGGHVKVVRILIDKGADVNRCDKYQRTPLFRASQEGHDKVVQILVDKGADVNRL